MRRTEGNAAAGRGTSPLLPAALAVVVLLSSDPGCAAPTTDDPLQSFMWSEMHERLLGGMPYVFDDKVSVIAPEDAEDSMNVPLYVDASALGEVQRILLFADLNPIVKILDWRPAAAAPTLGVRIKVQQATPVRAAALTADGIWHLGGRLVDAAGGGCTAPSLGGSNPDWAADLGHVDARLWQRAGHTRLRLRIMHPMDTGLVAGIPAFFIERLTLRDDAEQLLGSLALFEPVAENPVLTFDLPPVDAVRLEGRDNNGNPFGARVVDLSRAGTQRLR